MLARTMLDLRQCKQLNPIRFRCVRGNRHAIGAQISNQDPKAIPFPLFSTACPGFWNQVCNPVPRHALFCGHSPNSTTGPLC